MPNRILKESIRTSDSIDSLSWFEEVLFYRLMVSCDDYGRFDGRPAIIKNCLFPLKENLTIKAVSAAINTLASNGLVSLYEFEGKPYLCLPTWNKHQNVRAKKSKYPSPDDGTKTFASKCNQVQSDECICPRNPIQSESISESISESNESAFDMFWAAYPKKVGKGEARKAFKRIKVPVAVLVSAVERQKNSDQWAKNGGQFIPNPSTWLNQERWDDEVQLAAKNEAVHKSWAELAAEMDEEESL